MPRVRQSALRTKREQEAAVVSAPPYLPNLGLNETSPYVIRDFEDSAFPGDYPALRSLIDVSAGFLLEPLVQTAMLVTSRVVFACLRDRLASPIGFAVVEVVSEEVCKLAWLYVDPKHRGNGLGAQLLQAFLVSAARAGASRVDAFRTLDVAKFFAKYGFGPSAEFKHTVSRGICVAPRTTSQAICERIPAAVLEGRVRFRLARPEDRKSWNALILDAVSYDMGGSEMVQITHDAELRIVATTAPEDEDIVALVSMTTSGWVPFICCATEHRNGGLGSFLLALAVEWRRLYYLAQSVVQAKPRRRCACHRRSAFHHDNCPLGRAAQTNTVVPIAVAGCPLPLEQMIHRYDDSIEQDTEDGWPEVSLTPLRDRNRRYYERKGFMLEHGPLHSKLPFEKNKLLMVRPIDPLQPLLPCSPCFPKRALEDFVPELKHGTTSNVVSPTSSYDFGAALDELTALGSRRRGRPRSDPAATPKAEAGGDGDDDDAAVLLRPPPLKRFTIEGARNSPPLKAEKGGGKLRVTFAPSDARQPIPEAVADDDDDDTAILLRPSLLKRSNTESV
jgi:GNAT superfamily N-acetyltransferase